MESSRSPLQKIAQNHSQPSTNPSQATSQARTKVSIANSSVRMTILHMSRAVRGALCSHSITCLPMMDGWAFSSSFRVSCGENLHPRLEIRIFLFELCPQVEDSRAASWKRDRKRTGQGKGTLRALRVRCRGDAVLHQTTLNFAELWGGP